MALLSSALLLSVAHAAPVAWDWSSPHRYLVRARVRYPSATWLRLDSGAEARALDLEAQLVLDCKGAPEKRHTALTCTIEAASFGINPHEPDTDAAGRVAETLSVAWTGQTVSLALGEDGIIHRFATDADLAGRGPALLRAAASCLEVPLPSPGQEQWTQKQSVTQRPLRLTHTQTSHADGVAHLIAFPSREGRSVSFARRYSVDDAGFLVSSQHLYVQTFPDTQPSFTPLYREHVRCERLGPDDDLALEPPGVRAISVPTSLP